MTGGGLLATKSKRLAAFALLYLTMGLPFGFCSTALVTQMRRANVNPVEIGALVSTIYLPWAFKWIFGPVIDLLYSERLGRRRGWIVTLQLLMSAMLVLAIPVGFTKAASLFSLAVHLPFSHAVLFTLSPSLFSFLILLYNTFSAMQAVAIDALAVEALKEEERGIANGLMSAGLYLGIAIGGAGVLYLGDFLGHQGVRFAYAFLLPAACILLISLLVSLRLIESKRPAAERKTRRLRDIMARIFGYAQEAGQALLGTRAAVAALCVALLPMGAQAFALGWRSTLAVELGMSDSKIASLAVAVEIISAAGCVVGGYLSDRFGRRRMLAIYIACNALPNLFLAYLMYRHGWNFPVNNQGPSRALPPAVLLSSFWVVNIAYAVFQGLYSGTRGALFMSICIPAVAATQFSAYVSLNSFGSGYLAVLLGTAVGSWGYPTMLAIDAGLGLLCLAFLPFMRPPVVPAKERTAPPPPLSRTEPNNATPTPS